MGTIARFLELPGQDSPRRSPTIYTDEIREKLRLAQLGKKATEEARANMSKSQTGRKHSDETLANMKEYSNSEENKEIVSKRFKKCS